MTMRLTKLMILLIVLGQGLASRQQIGKCNYLAESMCKAQLNACSISQECLLTLKQFTTKCYISTAQRYDKKCSYQFAQTIVEPKFNLLYNCLNKQCDLDGKELQQSIQCVFEQIARRKASYGGERGGNMPVEGWGQQMLELKPQLPQALLRRNCSLMTMLQYLLNLAKWLLGIPVQSRRTHVLKWELMLLLEDTLGVVCQPAQSFLPRVEYFTYTSLYSLLDSNEFYQKMPPFATRRPASESLLFLKAVLFLHSLELHNYRSVKKLEWAYQVLFLQQKEEELELVKLFKFVSIRIGILTTSISKLFKQIERVISPAVSQKMTQVLFLLRKNPSSKHCQIYLHQCLLLLPFSYSIQEVASQIKIVQPADLSPAPLFESQLSQVLQLMTNRWMPDCESYIRQLLSMQNPLQAIKQQGQVLLTKGKSKKTYTVITNVQPGLVRQLVERSAIKTKKKLTRRSVPIVAGSSKEEGGLRLARLIESSVDEAESGG